MLCNHDNHNDTITSGYEHGFLDNNINNGTSPWQPNDNVTMESKPDPNKTTFKTYNITDEHFDNIDNNIVVDDNQAKPNNNETNDENHKSKISARKGVTPDIDTDNNKQNTTENDINDNINDDNYDDSMQALKDKIKEKESEIEFHKTVNYFLCLVLIVVVLLFCIVLIVFLLRRVRRERELGREGCAVKCFDHLVEDANETKMFVYSGLQDQEHTA